MTALLSNQADLVDVATPTPVILRRQRAVPAGFGAQVDEPAESLGERLILPPWLEPRRAEIERVLPKLGAPVRT